MSRWSWLSRRRQREDTSRAAAPPPAPSARLTPRQQRIAELKAGIKAATARAKAAKNWEQERAHVHDIRRMSGELQYQLREERLGRAVEDEIGRLPGRCWMPGDDAGIFFPDLDD